MFLEIEQAVKQFVAPAIDQDGKFCVPLDGEMERGSSDQRGGGERGFVRTIG
jgi:hypothetical protein